MTGSYDFARAIWPNLKWVFPVDGDEFWFPTVKMKKLLSTIPDHIDVLITPQIEYKLTSDYFNHSKDNNFYEILPWDSFKDEIREKGSAEKAALDRFKKHFVSDMHQVINHPLPMKQAFDLFNELVK